MFFPPFIIVITLENSISGIISQMRERLFLVALNSCDPATTLHSGWGENRAHPEKDLVGIEKVF